MFFFFGGGGAVQKIMDTFQFLITTYGVPQARLEPRATESPSRDVGVGSSDAKKRVQKPILAVTWDGHFF